jgi:hypothetical protein
MNGLLRISRMVGLYLGLMLSIFSSIIVNTNEIPQLFTVTVEDWEIVTLHNFDCQSVQTLRIEGVFHLTHFVQNTPQRPNVTFIRVRLVFK